MKKLFMLLACLFLLTGVCRAAEVGALEGQADALDMTGIEEAAGEYGQGLDAAGNLSLEDGLRSLVDKAEEQVKQVARSAIRSGVVLLTVVLLCGLAEGAFGGANIQGLSAVNIAGTLAVTVVAVGDASSLIGLGGTAINEMEAFSKAILPTMTALTAASGAVTSAAARQVATMLFSDILLTTIRGILLPMAYACIAASAAYAALGNSGLKRLAELIKWACTTFLTAILLLFVGYLTATGAIAGTADAATVKAAKFAVSGAIPVVGGILSDAAETMLAGAGILKGTLGVFGMLVVLGMCLVPFLQIGMHYLAYKLIAALAATVDNGRVTGLIDAIGGVFGLVLGMTGACALLLLISIISAVSVVTV